VGKIPSYLTLEEPIHVVVMRDSILLQYTWGNQSSALLKRVGWLVTGVSVQYIGPVFKSRKVSDLLLGCPDSLIRCRYAVLKSRYKITNTPLNNPERIYRVSQEECARLRESVPYVKVYRYNPKHLYQKLNGYGDNGLRKVGDSCGSRYCNMHSWCVARQRRWPWEWNAV